ncbi:MAG: carboxypeptidase-like regulatory domain-containing protein [bacterium]|nr:carboxypeptidase-like regulatory domain-containing protein [bacterium]MDD6868536.1 carboxypeptidase-like regulatory domain-containing protein [bacterium]
MKKILLLLLAILCISIATSAKQSVTAEDDEVYTVQATINDDITNLDAEIAPAELNTWSFGGQVTGDNGTAIEGLSVTLVDSNNSTYIAITDNIGKFEFSSIVEGKVTLTINSERFGYKPFEEEYFVDQDQTDYTFELENYSLSGSVIYIIGEGENDYVNIEGATAVLKKDNEEVGSVTTGADGKISFGDLKEGNYTLTVSAEGFVTESKSFGLYNGVDINEHIVLNWLKSTITGTVTRSDIDTNATLASVAVELLSGDAVVASATSAEDGTFSIDIKGLLAEDYNLQVLATEYYEGYEAKVTPKLQDEITHDIALSPILQTYKVIIQDEDGEAINDADLTVVKKVANTMNSTDGLNDETPTTLNISKDPTDPKTFIVIVPKMDNPGGEYTATATAPGTITQTHDFTFGNDAETEWTFTMLSETHTGISDISVDSSTDAEYYTLQGVRVANPNAGIYIRRNGTTVTKVLIR